MPAFSTDPPAQLAADLRTHLQARALENEREIQQVFKTAVTAADEAVDRELRGRGQKMYGRSGIAELRRQVGSVCWAAYDQRLAKYSPWVQATTHYRTNRALVQQESHDS